MGSSKQTQRQTQTRDPYAPAKPAINQSIAGIQNWLSNPASKAAFDYTPSDWTKAGMEGLANAGGAKASSDYLTNVLNGTYLNAGNPYQADLDASIRSAVMPSINAQFSNAGMSGSTMHQGMMMKGLTEGLAAPRYQNYQMERGNQQQAASMLPTVDAMAANQQIAAGQMKEGYDKAQFDEKRLAGLRPYQETAPLLQGYGSIGGSSTGTTTSKSTPSIGSQIAGGAMMGLGLMGGMPGLGMIGGLTPGMGLIGGGLNANNSSGAYASGLPWAPDQGMNPWAYSVRR